MFKLTSCYKSSILKPFSIPAINSSYYAQRLTTSLQPPSLKEKGYGQQISEGFLKSLKLHGASVEPFSEVSLESFDRIEGCSDGQILQVAETTFLSKINRLIHIINNMNQCCLNDSNKQSGATYVNISKEIELLVETLMSESEFNTRFFKWVLDNEVFSVDAFTKDQDRKLIVQTISRSCIKNSVFTNWDNFGSNFQDFVIQVWNDASQIEAEAFCDGIINQVKTNLKEKAYNSILECFHFHVLPKYSIKFGNRLLNEMVEIGHSPTALAYGNVFGFNIAVCRFKALIGEDVNDLKNIYTLYKSRITEFGPAALSALLLAYSPDNHSPDDGIALMELANRHINSDGILSKRTCQDLIETAERLLDHFHPNWKNQELAGKTIPERIQLIIENAMHIKEIPTTALFSILLVCYQNLAKTTEEESISFVSSLLQALVESGIPLETTYFESALMFYSKAGYSFNLEAVLKILEDYNLAPTDKLFYAALSLYDTLNRPEFALSVYKHLANSQDFNPHTSSSSIQTPEVLSLMIVVSAKLRNLSAVKDFWKSCQESGQLTTTCYLNALKGFIIFFGPGSKPLTRTKYIELLEYLISIQVALERTPPAGLGKVYQKLIWAHSEYCIFCPEAKFEDFLCIVSKGTFGYKRGHMNSVYGQIYKGFKTFARRNPDLKPIILTATKKVTRSMLKYYVKASCDTYYHLLTLLQALGDDVLFAIMLEQFQRALSRNHVTDPDLAHRVLELSKNKLSTKCFVSQDNRAHLVSTDPVVPDLISN